MDGKSQTTARAKQERHLFVSLGDHVMIQFEDSEERFKGTLVGMEPNAYLIVRMSEPSRSQEFEAFSQKKDQVIKCFCTSAGAAYGFKSALLNSISDPGWLVFVSYPTIVVKQELRRHQRANCFFPALAKIHQKEFEGALLDISESGCKFAADFPPDRSHPVSVGDHVSLFFVLGVKGIQRVSGVARNIKEDGKKTIIGVEFDESSPVLADEIDNYVRSVSEYAASEWGLGRVT